MVEDFGPIESLSPTPSDFLKSRGQAESNNDYTTVNSATGALGKYQILNSTYKSLRKYDTSLPEDTTLFLKDSKAQERAGSLLEGLYTDELKRSGHDVTHVNKDVWHFFGAEEGDKVLKADKKDPNTPIESIVRPIVIKSNPQLKGKTVAEVIALNSTDKSSPTLKETDSVKDFGSISLPEGVKDFGPIESNLPEGVKDFGSITKPTSTTDTGMLGAFGKAAASSATTALGAAPFMATGAEVGAELGLPLGPAGVIGFGIVGGLVGMVGGAKLMNAIGDTIPENIKGIIGFDKATREAERQAHPEASFAGDLSGNLVLFRPGSLEPIITKGGSVITPTMQRTGMGVFGGGLEAGQEYMNEGKIDPMHVGEAAAFTAWAAKPTPYMEKMGGLFKSREPLFDTNEKHWGADGEWIPPVATADGIPIRIGPTNKYRTVDESKRIKESAGQASILQDPTYESWLNENLKPGIKGDGLSYTAEEISQITGIKNKKDFLENQEIALNEYVEKPVQSLVRDIHKEGGSPYSSNAYGPGDKGVWYTNKEGIESFKPLPEDQIPKGDYVAAVHVKNPDGTSSHIQIDIDHIKSQFNDKPWTSPKVEGVDPLPETSFKSPEEWAQFVLRHEEEHTTSPRGPEEMKAEYENRINQQALETLRSNPYYSLSDRTVPPVPKNDQELKDSVYALGKNEEADRVINTKYVKSVMEGEGLTPQMMDRIARHFEGDKTIQLDTKEMEMVTKHYLPAMKANQEYYKYAIKEKLMKPFDFQTEFFGRQLKLKQTSKWDQLKNILTGGKFGGYDINLKGLPGAALNRTIFAGESASGRRVVLQGPDKDGQVWMWRNGKSKVFTKLGPGEEFKSGMKIGSTRIVEARNPEIEQHTPYTYERNNLLVQLDKMAQLRSLHRVNEYMKNFKQSDYFKDSALKVEKDSVIPADWKMPKNQQQVLEKFPELAGYAFPTRTAEIIEDMVRNYKPGVLTGLSGALIKNMMLNPLPHMLNEAWHLWNARGLTGWVTPAGIARFGKTGISALKSAMTQDPFFLQVLREGGSILSADVRTSAAADSLFLKANREFIKTPEAAQLAKESGISLGKLYDGLSKKSSIAMWTVRDAMYLQQIKEHMGYGKTMKEAIAETERHMPSYRIGERVGEGVLGADMSRRLSETLQNPNVTVFSRYHYGMMKSLVETAKDVAAIRHGKAGLKDFYNGVDTAAAIAVAIAVLYPLQDMVAQALTGNPDAKQRRAGPFHVWHAMEGLANGEKDPMAVISSIFTFNPALLSGAQLIFDHKLYNGQPIYHPEDSAAKIAFDIGKYVLTQMPLVGQAEKAQQTEEGGWPEWFARQADIESPPEDTVHKREKNKQKRERGSMSRSGKFEANMQDAIESITK